MKVQRIIEIIQFLAFEVGLIGRLLADCEHIASKFANTCSSVSEPIDFMTHLGNSVSCSGQQRCPGDSDEVNFTE